MIFGVWQDLPAVQAVQSAGLEEPVKVLINVPWGHGVIISLLHVYPLRQGVSVDVPLHVLPAGQTMQSALPVPTV